MPAGATCFSLSHTPTRSCARARACAGATFWFDVPYRPAVAPATPAAGKTGRAVGAQGEARLSAVAPPHPRPHGSSEGGASNASKPGDGKGSAPGVRPHDVLVIDDDELIREVMASVLGSSGFAVHLANDGASGLQMLKRRPYLAVFTDISMPILDGYACVSAFRAWERLPESGRDERQLVVGMSANIMPQDPVHAKKAGMDDFIRKPVSKERMLGVMAGRTGARGEIQRRSASSTGP